MYCRYSNELSQKERKYLEYFLLPKGGQLSVGRKVLMVCTLVLVMMFIVLACKVKVKGLELLAGGLALGAMLAGAWGIMAFRANWDKKRYAPILNGDYDVLRTKIKIKDSYDANVRISRGGAIYFLVYYCEGLSEPVSPISEKLYKLAKEGDEVTVVMNKSHNIFLGITFHEKYDRKLIS